MCSWKRISTVLLAGCIITTSPGFAEGRSLEQQKRTAVESALKWYETPNGEAILDAATGAHAVRSVAFDGASGALTVGLEGSPKVHWVFIKDSNRLAIDFYDAVNLVAGEAVEVTPGSPVESIRTSIFKLEPEIVSRIVLQMTGPVEVQLDDTEPGVLRFAFDGEPTADTPEAASDSGTPEPAPVANNVDALVAAIESELDAQLARADATRESLVTLFAATRDEVATRHEALKADAEAKEYPAELGYLVLLADHEALLGGHLGEVTGEGQLIAERVDMARAEVATVLKSDYAPEALLEELNAVLSRVRDASGLDAGRFEQIETIAAGEQQIALSAIDNLAQKISEAPIAGAEGAVEDGLKVQIADAEMTVEPESAVEADSMEPESVEPEMTVETEFVVADAPAIENATVPVDETVAQIDELMESALADESDAPEPASEIIVGEPEIMVAQSDAEEALAALEELTSEMSRLRSHPSAPDVNVEEIPLLAMVPSDTALTPEQQEHVESLEEVELEPLVLENDTAVMDAAESDEKNDSTADTKSLIGSQQADQPEKAADPSSRDDVEVRPSTDAAAGSPDEGLAVGGPEVDAPEAPASVDATSPDAAAEVADTDEFESMATPSEAHPVPVQDAADSGTNDPRVAAARAQEGADVSETPQVMAQASAGQPEVLTVDSLNEPLGPPDYSGDPMDQPVSIEFRDELLRNIIGLLAQKAGVNIIGGGTLGDITVSANMRDVPLRQAMNMLLRLENFGIVEEEGVYRIVPYEVAVQLRRVTRMVPLRNAQAKEVEQTLAAVTTGATVDQQVLVASNQTANVVVLSGPLDKVAELEQLVMNLDIAEPTLPTVTEAIRLNYAEPEEVRTIVESLLTVDGEQQIGKVEADIRGRSIVVTDLPVVVEQVRALIHDIDYPVQQVNIDSMVVDVTLSDDAATGVDWFVNLLRKTNTNGELIGNLSNLQIASDFGGTGALPGPIPAPGQVLFPLGGNQNPNTPLGSGVLQFGILSSDFDIQGLISAEVNNNNAEILANPKVVTLENQPAQIEIIQEFPYRELTQTEGGGQIASTEFKNIGTTLEVTPRVTADDDILVNMFVEQSVIVGFSQGDNVPITNNRRASTNVRTADRQTIFIGGLRRMDDQLDVRKVPVLGDLPVISPLFRTTTSSKQNTDLLIFVTCDVLGERAPDLTGTQQKEFDRLGAKPEVPDAQREVLRTWAKPNEMRDPIWKWRRSK